MIRLLFIRLLNWLIQVGVSQKIEGAATLKPDHCSSATKACSIIIRFNLSCERKWRNRHYSLTSAMKEHLSLEEKCNVVPWANTLEITRRLLPRDLSPKHIFFKPHSLHILAEKAGGSLTL